MRQLPNTRPIANAQSGTPTLVAVIEQANADALVYDPESSRLRRSNSPSAPNMLWNRGTSSVMAGAVRQTMMNRGHLSGPSRANGTPKVSRATATFIRMGLRSISASATSHWREEAKRHHPPTSSSANGSPSTRPRNHSAAAPFLAPPLNERIPPVRAVIFQLGWAEGVGIVIKAVQ
jgi:hypothetical protein